MKAKEEYYEPMRKRQVTSPSLKYNSSSPSPSNSRATQPTSISKSSSNTLVFNGKIIELSKDKDLTYSRRTIESYCKGQGNGDTATSKLIKKGKNFKPKEEEQKRNIKLLSSQTLSSVAAIAKSQNESKSSPIIVNPEIAFHFYNIPSERPISSSRFKKILHDLQHHNNFTETENVSNEQDPWNQKRTGSLSRKKYGYKDNMQKESSDLESEEKVCRRKVNRCRTYSSFEIS